MKDESSNHSQNKLAAAASDDDAAKMELIESLSPLSDTILADIKDQAERDRMIGDALNLALTKYRNDQSYAIGTYYAWHLRQLANGGRADAK